MAAYRDRVYGARVIVTSLCGSLQGHRQFMTRTELAGWTFVRVTIEGLGELFGTTGIVGRDKLGHFKSC